MNCERLLGEHVGNVLVADVQCDEIWTFVGKKEQHKRPHEAHAQEIGTRTHSSLLSATRSSFSLGT
jgi:hypothetical protein